MYGEYIYLQGTQVKFNEHMLLWTPLVQLNHNLSFLLRTFIKEFSLVSHFSFNFFLTWVLKIIISLVNITSLVSLSKFLQAKLFISYDTIAGENPCPFLHICCSQCTFCYFIEYNWAFENKFLFFIKQI